MRVAGRAWLIAGLLAPAVGGAHLTLGPDLPLFSENSADSNTVAVTVAPDGDVLLAGRTDGGTFPSNILLVRLAPTLEPVRWNRSADVTLTVEMPRAIATNGLNILVGGQRNGATAPLLARFTMDGTGGTSIGVPLINGEGVYAISADPSDGTYWVVGTKGIAPYDGVILHYSESGSLLTSETYRHEGKDTHLTAVVATRDALFVGGYFYDSPQRAFVIRRDRGATTVKWSWADPQSPRDYSMILHLAAGPAGVLGMVRRELSGCIQIQTLLASLAPETGVLRETVSLGAGAPSGCTIPGDWNGGLAMHPSLPVAAVSTGFATSAFTFTDDGTLSRVVDARDVIKPTPGPATEERGVAIGPGLNPRVYVGGYSGNSPPPPRYARLSGFELRAEFSASNEANRMLIAPNVLDLAAPGGTIRLVVKKAEPGEPIEFRIHDTSGRFIGALNIAAGADSSGWAELLWDGRLDDGTRIGPGSYIVVVTGGGLTTEDRRPFIVKGAAVK